jgi:hypothetical protein
VTWDRVVTIEPGMRLLLVEISAVRDPGPPGEWCRFVAWAPFKRRMRRLMARHQRELGLGWCAVHDEAYRVLFNMLPPCRNCACGRQEARREMMEMVGAGYG